MAGDIQSSNAIINSMPVEEIDDPDLLAMIAENCLSTGEKDKAKDLDWDSMLILSSINMESRKGKTFMEVLCIMHIPMNS